MLVVELVSDDIFQDVLNACVRGGGTHAAAVNIFQEYFTKMLSQGRYHCTNYCLILSQFSRLLYISICQWESSISALS